MQQNLIDFKKLSPLFIILLITELLLILLTINFLFIDNNGGNALGGVIAFIAALLNLLIIAIERAIYNIPGMNIKALWITEIFIIIIAGIYIAKNGISIG